MSVAQDKLLDRWVASLEDFALSFTIADKSNEPVDFVPSRPQRIAFEILTTEKRVLFLKGRQMWITTSCAMHELRTCMTSPGSRIAVLTQADVTAKEICKFYVKLYRGNPVLAHVMPFARDPSEHAILFRNGSQIVFGTANSSAWRGQPTHILHLTEASDYDDLGEALAGAGEAVSAKSQLIIESTGQAENDFCDMWRDTRSPYHKRFLCWLDHDEYRSTKPFGVLDDVESAYLRKHTGRMDLEQAQWWVQKYRSQVPSKRHLVFCEYPCTPEEAFLSSGSRYLRRPVPLCLAIQPDEQGIVRVYPYDATHQYAAGSDVAGGGDTGDFTTIVIGDVTTRRVAATMQVRLPVREFRHAGRALLAEYGLPVTFPEVNFDGTDLCVEWREDGVPIASMPDFGGTSTEISERHGWRTTSDTRPVLFGGIYDAVSFRDPWEIGDLRLVLELNALQYNKAGKPDHPKNGFSDLAVAFGLMVQACPQAFPPAAVVKVSAKPLTYLQIYEQSLDSPTDLDWNGSNYAPKPGDFYD